MFEKQTKKLLGIGDISKIYGIPKNTLYKLSAKREIPIIKLGRRCYISVQDWEEYLEKLRITAISGGEK